MNPGKQHNQNPFENINSKKNNLNIHRKSWSQQHLITHSLINDNHQKLINKFFIKDDCSNSQTTKNSMKIKLASRYKSNHAVHSRKSLFKL